MATDASGEQGILRCNVQVLPDPPTEASAEFGAPPGVSLFWWDDDYSQWPKYKGLYVQTLATLADGPIDGVQTRILQPPGDDDPAHFVVFRQRVRWGGSKPWGELRWEQVRESIFSIRGFDPLSSSFEALKPIYDALRVVARIRLGPGRRPGAADYPTRDEYVEAIREKIYGNPDRKRGLARVSAGTIASWLSISEATLKRYRRRYGIGIRDIRTGSV